MPVKTRFDYIVVGAGSSGCVVAARLSRKGSVLLLERGPSGSDGNLPEIISTPRNVVKAIWNQTLSVPYPSTPQVGLGNRPMGMPMFRGVVRGGCSAINGMLYVRGNRRDYDGWSLLGNKGWSFADVLPYFKHSEKHSAGASAYHGYEGPLDVCPLPGPSTAALAFIDAAATLGFSSSNPTPWDFNGPQQEDVAGLYHVNVRKDQRASAASAFLDGVADPTSLEIRTVHRVARIRFEGHRASEVECVSEYGVERFQADREVIVSAGAFESPKLLMLSGIGPADQLKALGLDVVLDLPGVGQNLHDHLQIPLVHAAKEDPGQSGFTAEAGLFLSVGQGSGATSPNLQYHALGAMHALANEFPPKVFTISPVLCAPRSRGSLRLGSANFDHVPVIDPGYLREPADVDVLLHGLELAEALARSGALGHLFDSGTVPFAFDYGSSPPTLVPVPPKNQRVPFIQRTAVTVWHPVGTCKMGPAVDKYAVVDSELRVYGVEGLRVADASIMPVIPSGNTNAACYMIGEQCADAVP